MNPRKWNSRAAHLTCLMKALNVINLCAGGPCLFLIWLFLHFYYSTFKITILQGFNTIVFLFFWRVRTKKRKTPTLLQRTIYWRTGSSTTPLPPDGNDDKLTVALKLLRNVSDTVLGGFMCRARCVRAKGSWRPSFCQLWISLVEMRLVRAVDPLMEEHQSERPRAQCASSIGCPTSNVSIFII